MKKIIFLVFLFSVLNINSQNKYGIIEYGKKSKTKTLSKTELIRKKENPERHKKFQKMKKMIADGEKKITFNLNFINNEGYFYAKPMLESDDQKSYKRALGAYDSGVYYNNNNNRLLQLNAFGELFLITKPKLNWLVTNQKKKIGKYNCFKATTEIVINSKGKKRIITVWFTPEIPISLGPIGYNGLPGLILELEDYKKIYYVKKITLNPKKEIKIERPIKGIKVTEKEFQEAASSTLKKFKKSRGY